MKKKSHILSTLLDLNNEKANKRLADLAIQIKDKVKESKDNVQITEELKTLKEFVYRVPDTALEIIDIVAREKKTNKVSETKSPLGNFTGKTYSDLLVQCVELLSEIRYIKPKKVLEQLVKFSGSEFGNVQSMANEVTKRLTRYDYNILTKTKAGYTPQRIVLDEILNWPIKKQQENLEFILLVAQELLSSSFEGTSMPDENKVTFHNGALNPTDFLKNIRKDVIDLILALYKKTEDKQRQVELIQTLEEATRLPMNASYDNGLKEMLVENLNYLTDEYRKLIFDDSDNIVAEFAIVQKIEERLYWINRNGTLKTDKTTQLREDIFKDELYATFNILAGNSTTYKEENGWDQADKKRKKEIDDIFKSINRENINYWKSTFNKVAGQLGPVEYWQFEPFRRLLIDLASQKPDEADLLLGEALKNEKPLVEFSSSFLAGFRDADNLQLWDKYSKQIINKKDVRLLLAVLNSLKVQNNENIREKDWKIIEGIIGQKKEFIFLEKNVDLNLHSTLTQVAARLSIIDSKRAEALMATEFKNNIELIDMHIRQLAYANRSLGLDISKWTKDHIKFILDQLIEVKKLDWESQDLLHQIGDEDIQAIIDVFRGRMKKDHREKSDGNRDREDRYEAIPYHINSGLKTYVSQHSDYPKFIEEFVLSMHKKWSPYNWHVSHFLARIGGPLDDVLKKIIAENKGDDAVLMQVARALDTFDGRHFDICIEIIKHTDNQKIIDKIDSNLYSTGVVSGEYGIANAYKNKAEQLEEYLQDKNSRVQKYAKRMSGSFRDSEKRERKRVDERKQIRKMEFEG